jgi:TRAP-type uncharacterized transport system fused permease subunit
VGFPAGGHVRRRDGYIIIDYTNIPYRIGQPNRLDILFGCIAVVAGFAVRPPADRGAHQPAAHHGLLYTFFGQNHPRLSGTSQHFARRVVKWAVSGDRRHFCRTSGAAATYVVIFIIFGKFWKRREPGIISSGFPTPFVGRISSGAALTAWWLPADFFGMISRFRPANVVIDRHLHDPADEEGREIMQETAGAVEAISSTGGQIMPPVMGRAAFIICGNAGDVLSQVIGYAILPAVIYYLGITFSVHLEAKKLGIQPGKNLPSAWKTFKEGWWNLVPVVVLLFCLLVIRNSVFRSAVYAIGAAVIISWFSPNPENRLNSIPKLLAILRASGKAVLTVAAATSRRSSDRDIAP